MQANTHKIKKNLKTEKKKEAYYLSVLLRSKGYVKVFVSFAMWEGTGSLPTGLAKKRSMSLKHTAHGDIL